MKRVTDPALLQALEGGGNAAPAMKQVTDPALLAQLDGESKKPGFFQNFGRGVTDAAKSRVLGVAQIMPGSSQEQKSALEDLAALYQAKRSQGISGAGGVVGSVAGDPFTYIPVPGGGGIASLAGKGATVGAASGLTNPVTKDDSRAVNTVVGGVTGGALGAAVPTITKGISNIKPGFNAAKQFVVGSSNDEQAAINAVKATAKQLAREGITVDDLTRKALLSKEAGLGATLPEFMKSSNLIAKQKQIVNQSGKASNYLRSYFKNRNDKLIPERLKQFAAPLIEKKKAASESYNRIFSEGNVQVDTAPLDDFINSKINTALPGGQSQQLFSNIKGFLDGAKGQGNTLQALHNVKLEIDNMVKASPTPGIKKILKAETVDTLGQLRNLMDNASPEYAATRRLYEEGTPGSKILTALEKSRVGSVADIRRRLFGNIEKQKELQRAMAPDQYRGMRLLSRSLDDIVEGRMGGSDTAFNQIAGKELMQETGAQGVEAATKPINAAQRLASWYSEKVRQRDYEALAKLYTDPDISALGKALQGTPRKSSKNLDVLNEFAVRALANYSSKE